MDATGAAWLAGYLDGDGSISMGKQGRAGEIRLRRPIIVFDSADLEILEHVKELVGCGSLVKKTKAKPHHRQAWSFRIKGTHAVLRILAEVVTYMRCDAKRRRAQLLLDELRELTPANGHYTPEMIERKLDMERRFFEIGGQRGSALRVPNG